MELVPLRSVPGVSLLPGPDQVVAAASNVAQKACSTAASPTCVRCRARSSTTACCARSTTTGPRGTCRRRATRSCS
ncbi:hypothetical protein [Nocardioides convexus]|uniref:hypothetical protein n=1 Tax=Nocardioides convexus TaxID=2712224 RepID=UPI0024187D04|nr:hypothetical protein [Nocardioides convexus]